ncbi:MAG TPA: hypothetical protein VFI31_22900 [Pirellulales bacterium]|nr:hypothetical protein [Pirellulales bacterium]
MKKLKTTFKWLAIVGGVLLSLALIVFAFLNWRAGVCLEQQLRPLREAGEPITIADLAPPPVPPERNALTYLRRAEKTVLAMNQELSPLRDKPEDYYERGRLNERGVDLVEATLNSYPDVFPLIQQAADAPEYVSDQDYTLPPPAFLDPYLQKVQLSRAFARLLQWRADLLLARHEREASLRNGLVLLRLDRHFQKEPMLVAYLVAVAVQSMAVEQIVSALEDGPLAPELHHQVDAEISRHLASRAFVSAIESDRAYGIDSFRVFRKFGVPWTFKQDECDYLKRMAKEIEIGASPRYQSEKAVAQMNADTQGAGPLTMHMLPALEAAREAQQRSRTRLQCLSVLNALTQHDNEGTAAAALDDLNLPDDIKLDPYNGQPLKVKRLESGWLVYSVGPNLKDDGGKIEKSEDVGVGPGAAK